MKIELIKTIDDDGRVTHPDRVPALADADVAHMMRTMLLVRLLDEKLLRFQRQGRIGFYLTATGEEATHVGVAQALRPSDWIYSSYREVGSALFRGYPLRTFLNQLYGNAEDPVKGRQMPVHHTARALNFVSVSSPVGTQIPHALGTALAARIAGKDDVAVAFFGDGATSTGAFHVSCNMAAVRKAPCIFFCRNNGWAISTPRSVQTASVTFAQKAIAYGMPGVLVDGNDVLAVTHVVAEAAARARRGEGPTLIEARTYRRGAHSSSDDPSVYRDPTEPQEWVAHDPIARFRAYAEARGAWSPAAEKAHAEAFEALFRAEIQRVEGVAPKPPRSTMFEEVLADVPWHLAEQAAALEDEIQRHGEKGGHH